MAEDICQKILLTAYILITIAFISTQFPNKLRNPNFLRRASLVYSWFGLIFLALGLVNIVLVSVFQYYQLSSDRVYVVYALLNIVGFYFMLLVFLAGLTYKLIFVFSFLLCPLKLYQVKSSCCRKSPDAEESLFD